MCFVPFVVKKDRMFDRGTTEARNQSHVIPDFVVKSPVCPRPADALGFVLCAKVTIISSVNPTPARILCWLVSLFAVSSACATESSPEGTWRGEWEREGSKVDITMRVEKSAHGYEGSFDSDGLRVVRIPLQKITWTAPQLNWAVASDSGVETYAGVVQGDALTGRLTSGAANVSFTFTRSHAPAPAPRCEELTFMSGDVKLAGTLFLPAGPGPHPGIVFLHGSGAEGRWASNYLADRFARRGFVALTFDKRGVGASGGDWKTAGFDELAADDAAAYAALAASPHVAHGPVGIHGHSQGGTLAPLVAVRIGHPAFVIASAGSGLSMRDTEAYSVENALGVKNLSPADAVAARAFVAAIVATAYEGQPYERAVQAWQAVRDKPWAFELPPATDAYWSFARKTSAYDPLSYWRQVTAPTLLVYGQADERIPPRASAERITAAYRSGKGASVTTVFFPEADHTFRIQSQSGKAFSWPRTAPGYPDSLIKWALEAVAPPPP